MLSGFGFILYCAFEENLGQKRIKEISH